MAGPTLVSAPSLACKCPVNSQPMPCFWFIPNSLSFCTSLTFTWQGTQEGCPFCDVVTLLYSPGSHRRGHSDDLCREEGHREVMILENCLFPLLSRPSVCPLPRPEGFKARAVTTFTGKTFPISSSIQCSPRLRAKIRVCCTQ